MPRPLWRPAGRARERILAFGEQGTGKTRAAGQIIAKLSPGDTAYVIDAENAWTRFLEGEGESMGLKVREEWDGATRDPEFEDESGNIVLFHARDYVEQAKALEKALRRAGKNDWIIVDSVTVMWAEVLRWYIAEVHGKGLPDFLLEHRQRQLAESKKATQGQDATLVEWNFINPKWNDEVAIPIVNAHCHLFIVAQAKKMRSDGNIDGALQGMFGHLGLLPDTQKRVPAQVHTVVLFTKSGVGKYRINNTAKDRDRTVVEDVEWDDFFTEYLRGVAGWTLKKETV